MSKVTFAEAAEHAAGGTPEKGDDDAAEHPDATEEYGSILMGFGNLDGTGWGMLELGREEVSIGWGGRFGMGLEQAGNSPAIKGMEEPG